MNRGIEGGRDPGLASGPNRRLVRDRIRHTVTVGVTTLAQEPLETAAACGFSLRPRRKDEPSMPTLPSAAFVVSRQTAMRAVDRRLVPADNDLVCAYDLVRESETPPVVVDVAGQLWRNGRSVLKYFL